MENTMKKILASLVVLIGFLGLIPADQVSSQIGGGFICGAVVPSPPPAPDPFGQNLGVGPTFVPYGRDDPQDWYDFHPLGVQVISLENYLFFDELVGKNIRIWNPNFSEQTIFEVASYEVVDSCEPVVSFETGSNTILPGECTQLRWSVSNVSELEGVYLDNEAVNPEGTLQVCPSAETTFSLRVMAGFGEILRRLTISISQPPPPPSDPILTVTHLEVEPGEAAVYEPVKLKITIENTGSRLKDPYFQYTGTVSLEDTEGITLEAYTFSKGDSSSISPVIENDQVNFDRWLMTVKVRFWTAVNHGKIRVVIKPAGLPELEAEGRITINPGMQGITCGAVVIDKLGIPFAPEMAKEITEALAAVLIASGCDEDDVACFVPPLVEAFVKIVIRYVSDLKNFPYAETIMGIWGVFDNDALGSCKNPVLLMQQMIREFNRRGVGISESSVHSPMLIWVTNAAGQRAGFISEEEIVSEIPGSRSIDWMGDKTLVYPSERDITVSLVGTGEGQAEVSLIDGQSGREMSYAPITVVEGSLAEIRLSDPQPVLTLDKNQDGVVDESLSINSVEELFVPVVVQPTPSPTSEPTSAPRKAPGICSGAAGVLVFPALALLFKRRQAHLKT